MPRHKKKFTPAQMAEAARMHYQEDLSKPQVAAQMQLSLHDVNRLIDEAKKKDIIRFHIDASLEDNLEKRLTRKHPHLERVFIVPGRELITTPDKCNALFRGLAGLGVEYFNTVYQTHPANKPLHVGVTGGARLLEFANAIPKMYRENVYVHAAALVGRGLLRDATSHIEPSVAASILWTRCGSFPGRCEYETIEPYPNDGIPGPEARREAAQQLHRLATKPSVQRVIGDMDQLDIVFAGFGFLNRPDATEAMENRVTMSSILESVVPPNKLADEGAVGDFCYCAFDADGNGRDKWRFFLSAGQFSKHPGIEFFKHMVASGKKVVGFGGPYLLPVIRAALKGKIINVLIIDGATARQLAESD